MPDSKTGFRAAFAKAKKEGKATFVWNGEKYSTKTAEEKAVNMSDKELAEANSKAWEEANATHGKNDSKSKSIREISESYINESTHRIGDEIKAKGGDTSTYKSRMASGVKGGAYGTNRPPHLEKLKKNYKKKKKS